MEFGEWADVSGKYRAGEYKTFWVCIAWGSEYEDILRVYQRYDNPMWMLQYNRDGKAIVHEMPGVTTLEDAQAVALMHFYMG